MRKGPETNHIGNIRIADYDYELPENRIAQHPEKERDNSKLLIFDGKNISTDVFRNLDSHLPANSLLVFNNSRVIRARLIFQKRSGARIEILCLEPISPRGYEESFNSNSPVEWRCIIGNLKKWKTGMLRLNFTCCGNEFELTAEKKKSQGEAWNIKFAWNNENISFGEAIDASGHMPLPPYIAREDNEDDVYRYQTVYSTKKGSVAAPTAGLHFTESVINRVLKKGVKSAEITLHVGAGTFQPVRSKHISGHDMHAEHFIISRAVINQIIENWGKIIAVGTTSVRTLESLFWLGVKVSKNQSSNLNNLTADQWEPYYHNPEITVVEALDALSSRLKKSKDSELKASTKIIIVPGYQFRIINGIITNFHQPRSTLLLLISAWTGNNWQRIYEYALNNGFRFLSYGDSSLLFRPMNTI